MTNFILGSFAAAALAAMTLTTSSTPEPKNNHQLTEEEQIELYEQVMEECICK